MAEVTDLAHRDSDNFDVRGTLRSLADAARLHWGLVACTTGLVLFLVTLYVVVWPPIYRAEALIMGERDVDASRDTFYGGWNVFRKDDLRTELEIMTSGPVLSEVVRREHLRYEDVYHPFSSYLAHLWGQSIVGRRYREFKEWLSPPEADAPRREDMEFGRIVVDMYQGISIVPVNEALVGRLTVKGPSRKVAAIANTLLDVYQQQRSARYQSEAQRAVSVLDEETERAGAQLKELEQRRLAFTKKHALAFDLEKESEQLKALTQMERDIASSQVKVAALEAGLAEVNRQLKREPSTQTTARVIELNTIRELAKTKRLEFQTQLLALRNQYREDSPEVEQAKANLARIDQLIDESESRVEKSSTETLNLSRQQLASRANEMRTELASGRASLAQMQKVAAALDARLREVPALQMQLKDMDRELLLANEKYTQLASKRGQAAVSLVTTKATIPSIRVVEYAKPPADKYWPRLKILYPAALLLGLLLGVAAAQIRRLASGRVRRGFWGRRGGDALIYGSVTVSTDWHPLAVRSGHTALPSHASGDNP